MDSAFVHRFVCLNDVIWRHSYCTLCSTNIFTESVCEYTFPWTSSSIVDPYSNFKMATLRWIIWLSVIKMKNLLSFFTHPFGIPSQMHSDQRRCFESTIIVTHLPYHPAGNGQCKRFNHTLHNRLHTLPVSRKQDRAACLPYFVLTPPCIILQVCLHIC